MLLLALEICFTPSIIFGSDNTHVVLRLASCVHTLMYGPFRQEIAAPSDILARLLEIFIAFLETTYETALAHFEMRTTQL